jgi:hypothetical protein
MIHEQSDPGAPKRAGLFKLTLLVGVILFGVALFVHFH